MDMIRDLWRGDVRLAHTYWFFYVFGLVILRTALNGSPSTAYDLPLLAFSIIYTAFMWVAIWRSATKFQGHYFWPASAKMVVILTIMVTTGISIEAIVET